jgi:CII-binding regulator of phage lambda lysogenization HflD
VPNKRITYFSDRRNAYDKLVEKTRESFNNRIPVAIGQLAALEWYIASNLKVDNDLLEALVLGEIGLEQRISENERDLEKLRASLLALTTIARNITESNDKTKRLTVRITKLEKQLTALEREAKPTISAIKDIIDKKVDEAKQDKEKREKKADFDFL